MNDIPEEALRTIEEIFGTRFVQHAADEAEPDTGQPFDSVFPESAAEVESLTKLAAHHRIPLVARGAGTAIYPGKAPQALVVRFDAMREIRLPKEPGEDWVEVEPGVTAGDYLSGFLQGTRQALSERGRESITLTVEEVNARSLGANQVKSVCAIAIHTGVALPP